MPSVPRQRGAAAVARVGLQPGHLPALHEAARGDGRLVVDQPATEADQDRGTCRPPRPRHHLPAGRGGRHRPDGALHPRRHPTIASATVMRVTALQPQTERNRLDRSVHRAENRRHQARRRRVRRPIRPGSRRLRDRRHHSGRETLVQLAESGDLDVRRQATWGMSVYIRRQATWGMSG